MNSVVLRIQGIGHVPSFKNNKMIVRGRLITNPKRQQWMEKAIRLLESQLTSTSATIDDVTLTVQERQCSIACAMPLDDSWQWIPEIKVNAIKVPKGSEGANIIIEQL